MKNTKGKHRRFWVVITIIGVVLVASAGCCFIFRDRLRAVITDTKVSSENNGKPAFKFDSARFPDWATSGNNWPDIKDATGDLTTEADLPVASISVHQCTPGSRCQSLVDQCNKPGGQCEKLGEYTAGGHCFLMLSYQKNPIDPDAAVVDKMKHAASFGGVDIREIGIKTLSLNTPEGEKPYQLHQYEYVRNGGEDYMRGGTLGYVSLDDGHVEIQSVCREASQLDETLPALEAVRLVAAP